MSTVRITHTLMKGALLGMALLSTASAMAIPARSGLSVIRQSDGSEITVSLTGDEHRAMYVSSDGYLLLPDSHGDLYYAVREAGDRIRPSRVMATDTPDEVTAAFKVTIDKESIRSAYAAQSAAAVDEIRRMQAAPSATSAKAPNRITDYPTTGKQKVLVILARFADVDFHTADIHTAIERSLNEKGYSYNGATGSVRDYYIDNSCGLYEPEMMVYGPVTLPQNMEYYGAPSATSNDSHPAEMIRDACRLLDDQIDFTEYDLDKDGFIDNVYLFYPGYSQADGASPNTIWPHAGQAWSRTESAFDGVKLDHYACSNEIDLGTNSLVSIGTFCHEFTHVLGLPDLYATDYSHKNHPLSWSLMADGARNNDGKTPPQMSAYERYALGWLEPETLKPSARLTELPDISENKAYLYRSATNSDEFFIFEYRAGRGWDSYLPGHGMLIWHIDYDTQLWASNKVNNDPQHQHIDLIEADNFAAPTRAGNAFPGTYDVRSITDATTPSLRDWSGAASGMGIYNIRETDSATVVFSVVDASATLPAPTPLAATDVTPVSFVARWSAVPGADFYAIDVYTMVRTGSSLVRKYVDDYRVRVVEGATSIEVTGLEPSTTYNYIVRALGNAHIGSYSTEGEATTTEKDFRFFAPETDKPTDVDATSFTARWKAMQDATEYFVTVYEMKKGESVTYTNDFSDEVVTPTGWAASAACAITKYYGGSARPALSMSGNLIIQSPGDDRDISSATFWCRGLTSAWDDVNEVRLTGYFGSGEWIDLGTVWPISTDKEGETITIDGCDFPAPVHSLRIEFNRPYGSGTLIVDDIEVTHTAYTQIALENYSQRTAGAALSVEITGLKPGTDYRYVVTASDGTLRSAQSRPRPVRTTGSAAITAPAVDSEVDILVDGMILTATNSSATVTTVDVYNVAGVKVASLSVAPQSSASLTLPSRGLYIVRTLDRALKLIL